MTLRSYSVWDDYQEQWDPDDIEEPIYRCHAVSSIAAAEQLANDRDSNYGRFIVRDDDAGTYREVELMRSWHVKRDMPTSLAELSSP